MRNAIGRNHTTEDKRDSETIKCPECSKVFRNRAGLHFHMPKHTGQFKFWCGECQRDFPHRDAYQAHVDRHEGIIFPCLICSKIFRTKVSLKNHQSEHTGVYLYRCRVCNKGFNLKGNFTKHQAICR